MGAGFVSNVRGALLAGIILFTVGSAGSKLWGRLSGRGMEIVCQNPKEKHEVEDLFCSCLFPEKYQGGSGIWYCGKCGGITDLYDDKKADDHDVIDRRLFGAAFLSCKSCETITWFMDPYFVEEKVLSYPMVLCPSCNKKHHSKGIDIS
jgi:hypothetical protein